jgi:DNA replication and repair protein RecF
MLDGRAARDVASRGQGKVLAAALVLGNVAYVRDVSGRAPVVLADDVPSELDASARAWFLDRLRALGTQVFLTALDRATAGLPAGIPHAVFHVERGHVAELV